ncbi:MAG TPA: cytochrome c maturation protein CcmE [SAR86 cluster bacterium]|mgnify:CR=1 FL=1|nr:cytochrome c maturation protein CcmE [SAR86 cluster bacterium]HJM59328.1 cytochrome c maturation protein CcmE [SAR86 cluster bacterium]|tara:strand:- start:15003 stop:15428 length:426 start_codon:yes stop_codon:yes gene_type:complete
MNPIRKQRIYALVAIVVASIVAIYLVISALSKNLNLFYSPTELVNSELSSETLIRAGGMVREGSIKRSKNSLNVEFIVTDFNSDLIINYSGILPDLFTENAGVVVQGYLIEDGTFKAIEVLAKHDENYMPPEVAKLMEKAE